ncbi:MAG TPA: hypothetical protein VNA89_14360 [Gemmatimonadaceae bacterium]|nr:hypothetical protein [Gemmatimonadaceae bacterium]
MSNRKLLPLALIVLTIAAGRAQAQGKSKGNGAPEATAAKPELAKEGKGGKPAKVVVTYDRAVDVTREVLIERGYRIERVETVGPTRVIYFYRGNRGRGRGRGPLLRMIVRRVDDRFVFDHAPSGVTVDINVRLKL